MLKIKGELKARENYLLYLKDKLQEEMRSMPKGSLHICGRANKVRYYHKLESKRTTRYLNKGEMELAKRLAQKDYNIRVLKAIEKELKEIKCIANLNTFKRIEDVYSDLHKARQDMIVPIIETDEQFVKHWESVEYTRKPFYEETPELYTAKGERVRSKSEIIIADLLGKEGIPYRYECPMQLKEHKAAVRGTIIQTVHPDFTVLNVRTRKELYWEHFGMMDDGEYAEKAIRKIQLYEQNGYLDGRDLILTYESRKYPLNQQTISLKIQQYLV